MRLNLPCNADKSHPESTTEDSEIDESTDIRPQMDGLATADKGMYVAAHGDTYDSDTKNASGRMYISENG